jgi:hypothetical protein
VLLLMRICQSRGESAAHPPTMCVLAAGACMSSSSPNGCECSMRRSCRWVDGAGAAGGARFWASRLPLAQLHAHPRATHVSALALCLPRPLTYRPSLAPLPCQMLISGGQQGLDIDDMRTHVQYSGGYHEVRQLRSLQPRRTSQAQLTELHLSYT